MISGPLADLPAKTQTHRPRWARSQPAAATQRGHSGVGGLGTDNQVWGGGVGVQGLREPPVEQKCPLPLGSRRQEASGQGYSCTISETACAAKGVGWGEWETEASSRQARTRARIGR